MGDKYHIGSSWTEVSCSPLCPPVPLVAVLVWSLNRPREWYLPPLLSRLEPQGWLSEAVTQPNKPGESWESLRERVWESHAR